MDNMAPEELSAFMKHTPRVILFGGQGTRALFSSSTAQTIQKDVYQSSAVSALVSQCHAAFLQEIASLDSDTKHVLDLNDTEFHDIKHFLGPSPKYRRNGLIQATTICLYQLVHYLAETERSHGTFASALEDVLEVTGFCAGLITAAVVAASNSVAQFQKFAVEAFRLSFWVGCRTAIAGRKGLNQQSEEGSCLLVVSGLSHEDVTRRLEEFRGKVR